MLRLSLLVALGASLLAERVHRRRRRPASHTREQCKFGGQPLPGATVIATEGNHRAVTTTDESGKYELPDLAPGTYTVEVQMFGFQTAHKELQIGPGSSAS